jgi:hypothetical protein
MPVPSVTKRAILKMSLRDDVAGDGTPTLKAMPDVLGQAERQQRVDRSRLLE